MGCQRRRKKNTIRRTLDAYPGKLSRQEQRRRKDAEQLLGREKRGRKKGIKILGAYVTVTEHDYFIIFEANDYNVAVEFFLPLVPSQTGKIVPVLSMDDWLKIMP